MRAASSRMPGRAGTSLTLESFTEKCASRGGFSTPVPEPPEPVLGGGAADPQLRATAGGQLEQLGEPRRTHEPVRLPELEANRGGEREPRPARGGRERGGAHARCLAPERELHRRPGALERRERADDRLRGRLAVEHASGPGRDCDDLLPA